MPLLHGRNISRDRRFVPAILLGNFVLVSAAALIGCPLAAAALTEIWRAIWRERFGWWPVPLLALVVFLIAGAQVGAVLDTGPVRIGVLLVFVGVLPVAAVLALGLTRRLRLPMDAGRTLAFSLGTRNSFVLLPFAPDLPTG